MATKKKKAVAKKSSAPLVLERKSEREELAKDMHTMQEIAMAARRQLPRILRFYRPRCFVVGTSCRSAMHFSVAANTAFNCSGDGYGRQSGD